MNRFIPGSSVGVKHTLGSALCCNKYSISLSAFPKRNLDVNEKPNRREGIVVVGLQTNFESFGVNIADVVCSLFEVKFQLRHLLSWKTLKCVAWSSCQALYLPIKDIISSTKKIFVLGRPSQTDFVTHSNFLLLAASSLLRNHKQHTYFLVLSGQHCSKH